MRIREIIQVDEDYLKIKEDSESDDMAANIATVLQFLQKRMEQEGAKPTISTDGFIQMVQATGKENFCYDDLVAANKIDTIKKLIKSFTKDSITINTDTEDSDGSDDGTEKRKKDAETTVSKMAKRQLKK